MRLRSSTHEKSEAILIVKSLENLTDFSSAPCVFSTTRSIDTRTRASLRVSIEVEATKPSLLKNSSKKPANECVDRKRLARHSADFQR